MKNTTIINCILKYINMKDQINENEQLHKQLVARNEQINNLQYKLKFNEIKSNKMMAQANMKTNAEKSKYEIFKKQNERLKQQILKIKSEKNYDDGIINQSENKIEFLQKQFQQKLKHEKEIQRGLTNQIHELDKNNNELKQKIHNLKKQNLIYKKILDIPKVLQLTGKSSPDEIPNYIDLFQLCKEKFDQIIELKHEINQLKQKLEQITTETLTVIQERENRLLTYEQQLAKLNIQKETLSSQIIKKKQVIQEKQNQILEQKNLLSQTKIYNQSTFQELTNQLEKLRSRTFNNPEKQMTNSQNEILINQSYENSHAKILNQITAQFQKKEEQYEAQIYKLQLQLIELNRFKNQFTKIQRVIQEQQQQKKKQINDLNQYVANLLEQIRQKDSMIQLMQNQINSYQAHLQKITLQLQKKTNDLNEGSKQLIELKSNYNQLKQYSEQREIQFNDEIMLLKKQNVYQEEENIGRRYSRLSLDFQPQVEENWEELYKVGLKNYNKYLNQLYKVLKK